MIKRKKKKEVHSYINTLKMYVKNFDPKIKTCEIGAYINKLIRHC